jgi:prepilin-type N-terminal cleavage/methylation domain-containing protein
MKHRGQRGFTLAEVMVSLLVLIIFILCAYQTVTAALWMNQQARDHYVAINLANNRLERARNLQYASLASLSESQLLMDADSVPHALNGNYRRTTLVNTNYGANLTEIFVQVDIRSRKTGLFAGESETVATVLPNKP